MKNNSGCQ